MPCPYFDRTDQTYIRCYCPGMDYAVILQIMRRYDRQIQLAYCKGSYKTAQYCPIYRAIEAAISRPRPTGPRERESRYPVQPGYTLQAIRGQLIPKRTSGRRKRPETAPEGPQ